MDVPTAIRRLATGLVECIPDVSPDEYGAVFAVAKVSVNPHGHALGTRSGTLWHVGPYLLHLASLHDNRPPWSWPSETPILLLFGGTLQKNDAHTRALQAMDNVAAQPFFLGAPCVLA